MKKQRPEVFFSILILVFGIILLLITPAGANFDEETYMARIWEMSLGHVMPNSYLQDLERLPSGFYNISYRRQVNLPVIDLETIKQQLKITISENDLMKYQTRALYFPTLFAVQAVIMRFFGPHLHYPIMVLYFLIRFSYLLLYCLLIYLTIKVLPFGKWVFGTLAVAPMCVIQAAAVSADSLIFGIAFLFIAWIVKLASASKDELSKKEIIITCLLILALGTLKPNAIFLLPLLIVIPGQRFSKNKAWLPIVITLLVSISIPLIWSFLAPEMLNNPGIEPVKQFLSFFTSPQNFFKSLWATISGSLLIYYKQVIGVAGYGYWNLPKIIYWIFPASLVLALFSERANVILTVKQRVLFGMIGLFNLIMIFVVFFVVITPVGATGIWGVQGRYFESLIPLLIIPFMFTSKIHLSKLLIGTVLALSSLVCVVSLFLSYHVVCGYAMATNQVCNLPYYKNWDTSTFQSLPLDKNTFITQSSVITCKELTGIQVWVSKNKSTAGKREFFVLKNEAGETLRTNWIQSDALPQSGWTTVYFTPSVNSLNQALQFEIIPSDGTGIPGLELGYFPTNEFSRGSLWINGKETDHDLVFKYSCADDFSTILK